MTRLKTKEFYIVTFTKEMLSAHQLLLMSKRRNQWKTQGPLRQYVIWPGKETSALVVAFICWGHRAFSLRVEGVVFVTGSLSVHLDLCVGWLQCPSLTRSSLGLWDISSVSAGLWLSWPLPGGASAITIPGDASLSHVGPCFMCLPSPD